jgi:hypothetical protein
MGIIDARTSDDYRLPHVRARTINRGNVFVEHVCIRQCLRASRTISTNFHVHTLADASRQHEVTETRARVRAKESSASSDTRPGKGAYHSRVPAPKNAEHARSGLSRSELTSQRPRGPREALARTQPSCYTYNRPSDRRGPGLFGHEGRNVRSTCRCSHNLRITRRRAVSCGLHRPTSQVIHRSGLSLVDTVYRH